MSTVKMKAVDTLHISSVSQHNLQPGETFEVSEPDAKDLEKRGLAKRVGAAKVQPEAKAEDAPANKAEPAAPLNKATVSGKAKS